MNEQPTGDQVVEDVVVAVRRWGLHTPVLLGLEVGKPAAFFGAQVLHAFAPFLRLYDHLRGTTSAAQAGNLASLLEDPAAVAALSDRLVTDDKGTLR